MMRHRPLPIATMIVGLITTSLAAAADPSFPSFEYASVDQAALILTTRDRFVRAMSEFDRQSRVGAAHAVSEEQYLLHVRQQILAWSPRDRDRFRPVLDALQKKLAPMRLPLPDKIVLVKTTGKEEGGAAYCRGACIVLPRRMIVRPETSLERLLVHEMFHVLSSQNPQLRQMLYGSIGFHPCNPIPLPEPLDRLKITNPDGPGVDNYVVLGSGEETRFAAPLLYAKHEYDHAAGGSFFAYMQFRLLLIHQQDGRWLPQQDDDGRPVLLDPGNTPAYFDRIGRNTGYIIHPDEILADNFVHLVMGTPNLQSPAVVAHMKRILARQALPARAR